MSSDDLVSWLRLQLDEDERLALLQPPWPWKLSAERDEVWAADDELIADVHALSGNQLRNTAEHIANHDPSRVLREVEALRSIIDVIEQARDPHPGQPCTNEDDPYDSCELHVAAAERRPSVIQLLAAIFSDRPGYREEWKP